nr:MAG TPA: Rad50 zinc hook motif [Caudoviricetes sp.]
MALAVADISVDTAMMLTPIPISHTHLLAMCPTCGIFYFRRAAL